MHAISSRTHTATSPKTPNSPSLPRATSFEDGSDEEEFVLIPSRSTARATDHTESPIDEIRSLLDSPSYKDNTSEYILNIRQALDANDPIRIIDAISENFHTESLTNYGCSLELLYSCAKLIREQPGGIKPEHKPQYDRIISILKANPYSGFEQWVQQKHFAKAKELLDSCDTKEELRARIQHQNSRSESGLENFDALEEEFFEILDPHKTPTEVKAGFSPDEKQRYAEKFGCLLVSDTVRKGIKKFEKSILAPLMAYTRSQFLAENPALIDSTEFKRESDTRFAIDASSARTYKEGVGNGALINHYDQKNGDDKVERLRCGAIHTENAAKQYVLKMLLENRNQNADPITIIDTRYLDVMNPLFGDVGKLKKHRKLIEKVITKIAPNDGKISFERVQEMIEELISSQLIQDEQAEDMLDLITALNGKKIEFISLDLGATEKSKLQDKLVWDDKKTVQQLHHLQKIFHAKLSAHESPEVQKLLFELQAIIDLHRARFASGKNYISGHKAFQLDELIARLSLACGMVSSAGCMSNKDRGSSAYLFHCIAERVFKHQKEQFEQLVAQGQPIPEHFFSLKDFHLVTEEEKQIARDVILTNPAFLVTLLNTSFGGSKCHRLNWLIEEAFNGDKDQVRAFNRMQAHGKLAKS